MFKIWKLADTLFVLRSTFCVRLVMWLRAATDLLSFSSKTHRSIRVHATVLMRFRFIKSSIHIFLRFYSSTILKSQNEERADFTFHDIILLLLMRKIFWRIYIIVTLMSEEKKPRHIAIKNTRDLHTRSIYIWRLRIEQLKWARCLFLSH